MCLGSGAQLPNFKVRFSEGWVSCTKQTWEYFSAWLCVREHKQDKLSNVVLVFSNA